MAPHTRWVRKIGRDEWGVYALIGGAAAVLTLLTLWWIVKQGEL